MRPPLALLLLLAGCATVPGDNLYVARGSDPDWSLSIGNTLMTLSVRSAGPNQAGSAETFRFPRATPVRDGDRTVWRSTSRRGETIMIDAQFAPRSDCAHFGPEAVRVVVNGREYRGCGGREIRVTGD